jgi:hypothetical protein
MALADAPWPKIKCNMGNTSRSAYAYAYSGEVTRSVSLDSSTGVEPLIIGNDTVYVGPYAYTLDGELKWTASGLGYSGWPALSDEGIMYYGRDREYEENKGYLDHIDMSTGRDYQIVSLQWELTRQYVSETKGAINCTRWYYINALPERVRRILAARGRGLGLGEGIY